MKIDQLIEYDMNENIFLGKETSSRSVFVDFCFSIKLYMKYKQAICSLVSMYFDISQNEMQ